MEQKSKEVDLNEIIRSPSGKDCNISPTSNELEGCSSVAPSGLEWRGLQSKITGDELMSENKEGDPTLFPSNQNMNFGKISTHIPEKNKGPLEVSQTEEGPSNVMQSEIPFWGSLSSSFNKAFLEQYLNTTGKCVINENPGVSDDPLTQNENMQSYLSGETYDALMNENSLIRKELELPYYGINLRELLESKCFNASKNDRLHLFKKIVQIVDIEHSKGIALTELRPSSFIMFKTGDVKYIGSLVETGLTRKRSLESQIPAHDNFSEKVQKVGEDKLVGSETSFISKFGKGKAIDQYTADNIDMKSCSSISNAQEDTSTGNNWLTSDNVQLERKWYDFQMEFQIKDLLSQNIYSLGVLLFELLCDFDSIEEHSVAMYEVHHRIFPPCFFSENPKEAGFCFWLLHPESSSRPTTSEILQSELLLEFDSTNLSDDEASCADMEEEEVESDVLLHFLVSLKQQMQMRASNVLQSLEVLDVDLKMIENKQTCIKSSDMKDHTCSTSRMNVLKDKLSEHINELENIYFSMRSNSLLDETPSVDRPDKDVLTKRERLPVVQHPPSLPTTREDILGRAEKFFDGICKFVCYNKFEVCGTLKSCDILNLDNVICCLSFDRDEQYIAAAGVSKKIKIFEFDSLLDDCVDIQYPILEMSGKSKFSCISWNSYIKNFLASTDYDGLVQLWDASIGQGIAEYNEHKKRTWSVDFSQIDPTKFASGGDDCCLKIWNVNGRNSICTICNSANICCVQFSSYSSHLIAFGSADYKINCYDLRHTKIPWCTLTGHDNAVSYVRFLDSDTIVSASIDSTLKLWDLKKTSLDGSSPNACTLTYRGHANKKNFVGLAVLDGYIACGSETNEVYAYYKSLPMPVATHKFECVDPLSGVEKDGDHFVSSVIWRSKSQMLAAANSNGTMEILRMT